MRSILRKQQFVPPRPAGQRRVAVNDERLIAFSGPRDSAHGGAVAAEFKVQQPLAGALIGGHEAPFAGSFARNPVEVVARAGVIEVVTNDTT